MKNFIRSLLGLSKPGKPAPPTPPQAETSRMMDGMIDQLAALTALEDARNTEAVVVRLQPQIPLRDADHPRSWLGGGPAMAETVAWPVVDGEATRFIGQICCADLPADLWGGLGPRAGWLALFIHPKRVVALHLDELGPWRACRGEPGEDLWLPYLARKGYPGVAPMRERPRWPVDLVAVRPGGPDPRTPGRSKIMREIYKRGHDVRDAEHRPFDRNSTLEMLAMIEGGIVERLAAMTAREQKAATSEDERSKSAARRGPLEAALPTVRAIAERVRGTPTLTEDDIGAITAELSAIAVPGKTDEPEPLTNHPAASWIWNFEERRLALARHAYCADPDSLPEPTRAYCEAIWREMAGYEMAGMGHVPFGNIDDFDPRSDVTLLELPSTDLIGWTFGDVNNLVVCIGKDDLAAGRFDRVRAMSSYY